MPDVHIGFFVGWMAPRRRLTYLMESENVDHTSWEAFRDGLVHRWTNLNIVCGLINGATTTILFSDFEMDAAAFAFGIISLLSSLMATGFGVGLMYVLGDVDGHTLKVIAHRFPNLYLFSLAIPQIWAGISFVAFFVYTCILGWEASNKGPLLKIGILATVSILAAHLIGFVFLFRSQEDPEALIPEPTHPRPLLFGTTSFSSRSSQVLRPTLNSLQSSNIDVKSNIKSSRSLSETRVSCSPIEEEETGDLRARSKPPFRHRGTSSTLV